MHIGAHFRGDRTCEFIVWAPFSRAVELKILPDERIIPMQSGESGYWRMVTEQVPPGTDYLYILDGEKERPDPASFFQPHGVHKPSQVVDHHTFPWQDSEWKGIALSDMIIYELHAGTFTKEGTFDAIIPRLKELGETGINAIEIMPVAQFPGERNWGYDGAYPFAVQNSYGGPDGLKRLVNECHKNNIAVILDVVYNHFGPEGTYIRDFGPYFTNRYHTPWGEAINFDGQHAHEVRNYFIQNALYWFREFHMDALRLDALHAIHDKSARPFLLELSERVDEFSHREGRKRYLIAEDDTNNPLLVRPRNQFGFGLDAQWCDDFHHSLHTVLTEEEQHYYIDFGKTEQFAKSMKEGFVYSGQYSHFRKNHHGDSSRDIPAEHFIVFTQNHDQIGNRMFGERLSGLVSFESLKLAAAAVILSPYVPQLFMGEEYGETSPFLFFVSHSDPRLIQGVREGRKKVFDAVKGAEIPDPQSVDTFIKSRINWEDRFTGQGRTMLNFYKRLIHLRKTIPALSHGDKNCLDVWEEEEKKLVFIRRWKVNTHALIVCNFSDIEQHIKITIFPQTEWKVLLNSSDNEWGGPGSLLPDRLDHDKKVTMRAGSAALFLCKMNPETVNV